MIAGAGPARVLVLIDSLGQGGAEQSLMVALPPLREQGVHAEMLLMRSLAPHREAALAEAGVPVRVLGPCGVLTLAWRVRKVLRQERPDLLHVTLFEPIVAGALAAIGTGVPVLASQASTPPEVGRDALVDASGARWKLRIALGVEAFVLRHLVTRVHAVTEGVGTVVSDRFGIDPAKISVAERGRDGARFAPPSPEERSAARAEFGLGTEDQVIAALGRHEPAKGFGDLIEAVARLRADWPDLHVILAGREGNASSELRAAILAADLQDRFHLVGDRSDPERVLAAADLFVLSSRREGTSGATIEAMATGLPVVATDLPGLEGILVDGLQARIVPVGAPQAIADAVAELLGDPEMRARLGANGLATFEKRFTLERSVAALGALYRDVAIAGR